MAARVVLAAVGDALRLGARWAWWPSLALVSMIPIGAVAIALQAAAEPAASDTEDMTPIVWMGAFVWAVGGLAFIVWLLLNRRPSRDARMRID